MPDIPPEFWWSAFGSFAVELGAAFLAVSENDGHLPRRFYRLGYVLTRLIMLPVAGVLAIAVGAASPMTAIYVGASAPLAIDRLRQGVKPPAPPGGA